MWLSPPNDRLPPRLRIAETQHEESLRLDDIEEGTLVAALLVDHPQTGELTALPLHQIDTADPQGQLEAVIYDQGLTLGLSAESRQHADDFPDQPSEEAVATQRSASLTFYHD